MWTSILPPCGIIATAMTLIYVSEPYIVKLFYGTTSVKYCGGNFFSHVYIRNSQFTDNPYAAGRLGLQGIPDE